MNAKNVDDIADEKLEKWVREAQNGDSEAFRQIYNLMSDQLFSYALSHTKSRDEAMDIVQEAFIELWSAFKRFEYAGRHQFYGFVYIILKRRLYRYFRRVLTPVELEERFVADSYEIEIEDYRYLEKMLNRLPERYQEIIRLRYWSQMTYKEIAACLDVNESTAKVWHHRAVKALGGYLEELNSN